MHAYSSPEARRWYLRARSALRAACALALLACLAVPILCALGLEPACALLYRASPALAQRLRPEQLCCASGGIELRVKAVERAGSEDDEVDVVFVMRDLAGDRLNGDSYPYAQVGLLGSSGPMNFAQGMPEFDKASRELRLPIRVSNYDGGRVSGKLSLSLYRVRAAAQYCEAPLAVDLSDLSPAKPVPMREDIASRNPEHPESSEVHLVPSQLCTPLEGIELTAVGYVDGKLRVQFYFADPQTTPVTGDVWLENSAREAIHCADSFSFEAPGGAGCYEEFLFDLAPEEASACQIRANLLRYGETIEGPWNLTFQT